jgi:fructose-bisphosphate aldolase class II
MALVTLKDVVDRAYREGYAVPAFNFWTYEDALAIVKGAAELSSPVILMASLSCLKHLGEMLVVDMIRSIAEAVRIPVVLHLDHAEDVDTALRAMRNGFTSVMYDGSKLPIEENIKNTRLVVRVGRALGVSVEAEIGRVGRGEEGEAVTEILTEPEGALMFFSETQVDALAIAAGTCHGMQKQEAAIHFEIVEGISKLVAVPLVLHGSSGVRNEDLVRISRTGISKINFGTRLRRAFIERCSSLLGADPGMKNHLSLIEDSSVAITETVKEKIGFLGCGGKA